MGKLEARQHRKEGGGERGRVGLKSENFRKALTARFKTPCSETD